MFKYLKFIAFCACYMVFGFQPAIALLAFSLTEKSAEQFMQSFESLDAEIDETLKMFNVPGAAIGLVVDNQIVLLRGYGARNLAQGLPVTENTVFPIASCTKAFTAFILGQLVDEGKIQWDDPVIKHIPEFRLYDAELTSRVTIRDLAAHRTGLFRHDALWFFSKISRTDVMGLLQYLEPVHQLREKFEYNNLMYSIAGIVIERHTGQTWEEAVKARILMPLGMEDSNTTVDELQAGPDFSLPYAEIGGKITTIPFCVMLPVSPGGGINSNVGDMVKWIQIQLSGGTFSNRNYIHPKTLQETRTLQIPFPTAAIKNEEIIQSGYGLGWFIGSYRGHPLINHGGHIDGFYSEVALLPEEKCGIVILTNSSTDGGFFMTAVRNIIFDKLLGAADGGWMKKAQEQRKKVKLNLGAIEETKESPLPPAALEPYIGDYEHPAYGRVKIKIDGQRLTLTLRETIIPLIHISGDVFKGQIPGLLNYAVNPTIILTFFKTPSGDMHELHIPFESFRGAKPVVFQRNADLH